MSSKVFTVTINDQRYAVSESQSLLSVVMNNNVVKLKKNAVLGDLRSGVCGMGVCFECEVFIEGLGIRRSCLINVETDLVVKVGDMI